MAAQYSMTPGHRKAGASIHTLPPTHCTRCSVHTGQTERADLQCGHRHIFKHTGGCHGYWRQDKTLNFANSHQTTGDSFAMSYSCCTQHAYTLGLYLEVCCPLPITCMVTPVCSKQSTTLVWWQQIAWAIPRCLNSK